MLDTLIVTLSLFFQLSFFYKVFPCALIIYFLRFKKQANRPLGTKTKPFSDPGPSTGMRGGGGLDPGSWPGPRMMAINWYKICLNFKQNNTLGAEI